MSNILSLPLILNQVAMFLLELEYLKSKRILHKNDTFYSSGYLNKLMFTTVCTLVQPCWFLYGTTTTDTKYNEHTVDIKFQLND